MSERERERRGGGKQSEKLTQLSKKQGNARENKAEQGWATAVGMKDQGGGGGGGEGDRKTRARNTITVEKVATMCRKGPRGLKGKKKNLLKMKNAMEF